MPAFLLSQGARVTIAGWYEIVCEYPDQLVFTVQPLPHPPCWRCNRPSWFPPRQLQSMTEVYATETTHDPWTVNSSISYGITLDRWIWVHAVRFEAGTAQLQVHLAAWAHCLWCGAPLDGTKVFDQPPAKPPQEAA